MEETDKPYSLLLNFTYIFLDLTMILYHYTNLPAGVKIMQEGFIRVANEMQNPALWFSKHEIFDPSALKMYQTDMGMRRYKSVQEQAENIGCMRFIYDNSDKNLRSWKEYGTLYGLSRQDRRRIEKSNSKEGSKTSDWFCSLEDLDINKMVALEVWIENWVDGINREAINTAINNARKLKQSGSKECETTKNETGSCACC